MSRFKDAIIGKKTYFLGLCSIVYGLGGLFLGKHDYNTAADLIWSGLTAMTIRHAIGN